MVDNSPAFTIVGNDGTQRVRDQRKGTRFQLRITVSSHKAAALLNHLAHDGTGDSSEPKSTAAILPITYTSLRCFQRGAVVNEIGCCTRVND